MELTWRKLYLTTVFRHHASQHQQRAASAPVLDRVSERIRYLHFSLRMEQAYVHWTHAFVRFYGMRHLAEMGGDEVAAFMSWLASERQVAVATHRQALSALLLLYQRVLGHDVPWMPDTDRPQRPPRLPVAGALALRHGNAHFRGFAVAGERRGLCGPCHRGA